MKKRILTFTMALIMCMTSVLTVSATESLDTNYSKSNLEMALNETQQTESEIIISPKMMSSSKTPVIGTKSDYTVYQGTTYRNIAFENLIRDTSAVVVGTGLSVVTGGFYFLSLGVSAVLVATAYSSNTKTMYCKQYKYGYKSAPALYHMYKQKWYLDSEYKYYVATTYYYTYYN